MNWRIHPVGKPSFSWAREGVALYEKRLRSFAGVSVTPVRSADRLLSKTTGPVVALDETGVGLSTSGLADRVRTWERDGIREATVWLGGAEGLTDAHRARADLLLALGPQTLMHELALLVWMEQLYRVHTLLAGHPYHRA